MASNTDKTKSELSGWLVIGLIFVLIASVIIAGRFFKSEDKLKIAFKNGQTISFFIAIYNEDKLVKGAEVLFFNPISNRFSIISILPKTYISFGKPGYFTIEEAFNKKITNDDFKEAIARLLGTKIDYYIFLEKENLIRFIDMIGGVEIYTESIKDVDAKVNIPQGLITMDGDKSIEYLSYIASVEKREDEYAPLKRIQNYIRSFLRLKEDFLETFNEDAIINHLYKTIITNITINECKIFYNQIKNRFNNKLLDYSKGADTIILYCDKKNIEGYDYILHPKKAGEWIRNEIKESLTNLPKKIGGDFANKITVEIKNGTDIVGLALRGKRYLETYGFDIIEIGNAESDNYQNTVVIIRTSEQKGNKLADLIRCRKIVKGEEYAEKKVDVTVILGKDFDGNVVK
ncbi:MAG: hypothetical protein A2086_02010 [Spirochaetes bacterium GWD1_27_9]|nr:MAG: hypothetical protein A2Z98_01695 [Spirochaetes bacterium GWB1_27_13]OHD27494.1 MAG: hypothetical protein A2Y34_04545 [Spirochaetes bacterium GWC1_27_15]OHD41689.1 MAG: hypothetical protein A2086_02010 [Spirochaetes bacterium GWD1_27_9]